MQLFFADNLDSDLYTLSPEESKHCVKVLRMEAGHEVHLTDGLGTLCRCRIVAPDPKACVVEVIERIANYEQRNHHLHLAVAPTKNTARLEWFVEKAVEVGIDEITPILCDNSERMVMKTERLEKIIVSAMKQSLKAYKPRVHQPVKLVDFIAQMADREDVKKMMCYCDGDNRTPIQEVYSKGESALVLIGPEGDFSPREIEKALASGFKPITLGNCRLRTETAALYATVAINFMNT